MLLAVIGAGEASEREMALGREVGSLAAERGWTVICGGLGGVMEAVSEGASGSGGTVVGILPGAERRSGNQHLSIALPTNMGHGRNVIIAQAADVLIAIGGGFGTLSEMALGLKMGKTVISLESWKPDPAVIAAETAGDAIDKAARSALHEI